MRLEKSMMVNNRLNREQQRRESIKNKYIEKQMHRFHEADKAGELVGTLADQEQEIVERLKNTMTIQKNAYKTLDNVVKESYTYY